MKQFMEQELGWKAIQARIVGHSTLYLMRKGKHVLQMEAKPEGDYVLTYARESRIIPNLDDITKALKLKTKATVLDQARILDQVLDKLVRKHRGSTEAEVQDMMRRFAEGHF